MQHAACWAQPCQDGWGAICLFFRAAMAIVQKWMLLWRKEESTMNSPENIRQCPICILALRCFSGNLSDTAQAASGFYFHGAVVGLSASLKSQWNFDMGCEQILVTARAVAAWHVKQNLFNCVTRKSPIKCQKISLSLVSYWELARWERLAMCWRDVTSAQLRPPSLQTNTI